MGNLVGAMKNLFTFVKVHQLTVFSVKCFLLGKINKTTVYRF